MEAIVLYPTPAIGHLIPMVELGKLIHTYHPLLTIHILIAPAPYNAGSTSPYIASVSATNPYMTFHNLPSVTLPSTTSLHHETLIFELIRLNNPYVHQSLLFISKTYNIQALIIDFFCSNALSVAAKLNIPAYHFSTSGAAALNFKLYLPTIHKNTTMNFKDLNTLLNIPGLPPLLPSSDLAKLLVDRNDKAYECFLDGTISLVKSAGIIVNTFESLEPKAIQAVSNGLCVPDGPTPRVYYIGPLIATYNVRSDHNEGEAMPECLTWLNSQPSQSVVFLCFGSLGLFSIEQLNEIALGLERSGQRFLWVVRNPPS